jgi:hypothetical protein
MSVVGGWVVPLPAVVGSSPWLTCVFEDSRGNRLEKYRAVTIRRPSGDRHVINALCCTSVARQLELVLAGRNPRRVDPVGDGTWSHAVEYVGPFTTKVKSGLDLLQEVLTVPSSSDLDGVFALDFYKVPPTDESPEWTDTLAGGLVRRGKYWSVFEAGRELADSLAALVRHHPYLTDASQVLAIPGTKNTFGERLAGGVADRLSLPCVRASLPPGTTLKPAKEGHESNTLRPYELARAVSNKVLIVDDVYRSGLSMRSLAAVAKAKGATAVLGVVGARTMRRD